MKNSETQGMQLELVWQAEDQLRDDLARLTGQSVELNITDNTRTMLSMRQNSAGNLTYRLHHMFLAASPSVIQALARWSAKRRHPHDAQIIDTFIAENQHRVREGTRRRARYSTLGQFHDLQPLYEDLNHTHFDQSVTAAITWGKEPSRRARRCIRLGSYVEEDNLIRIHPGLDQKSVPVFMVRYIVFHEMLHAFLGVETTPSGRRRVHSPKFNALERAYPDYPRALAWLDEPKNLRRVMRPSRALGT